MYIHSANIINTEKTPAELEETVEYEMDSEDERFVHTINDANNKLKAASNRKIPPLLTDDWFEKMIDILEKEAFRKIHKVPSLSIHFSLSLVLSPTLKWLN